MQMIRVKFFETNDYMIQKSDDTHQKIGEEGIAGTIMAGIIKEGTWYPCSLPTLEQKIVKSNPAYHTVYIAIREEPKEHILVALVQEITESTLAVTPISMWEEYTYSLFKIYYCTKF